MIFKKLIKSAMLLSVIASSLASFSAYSEEILITAEFKSDIAKPDYNKFTNTTKKGGYCTRFPSYCPDGIFAVGVQNLSIQKYFDKSSSDLLNHHLSIDIDGTTRMVRLVNTTNGFETEAEFRISSISNRIRHIPGNTTGWTGINGGCRRIGGSGANGEFSFAWSINETKNRCSAPVGSNTDFSGNVDIYELSFAYVLTTPDPLKLPAGEYIGETIYTIGDGKDIDYHALHYNDQEVRIKILATVEHAFFYRFPPGSENVQLSPPNGWSSWINGGMIPQKLSKEVPFALSSSSGFKVWMQCEHNSGAGCGLKYQATAETVPLDVKMTIPGFTSNRQPVRNMLLNTDAAGHTIDLPGQFVVDLRSKLDFVVNRPEVEKMVKAPGSNWKGAVTLIFDSEVE